MYRNIYLFFFLLAAACETEDMSKPGALVPLTADQDTSIPSQAINGTLLHVEAFGKPTDPLLIVIHGGPGGDFRSLLNAKQLADDGFYVVFYDQRGTGLSRREDKSQYESREAVQLFIDDLDALVTLFRFGPGQKVFLFGHSWGAMLATAYINQHPEKIDGVILAEPGGLTWPQTKDYLSRSNKVKLFNETLNDALFPEHILDGRSEDEVLDYKASFFTSYENAPGNVLGNPGSYPFWRNGAVSFLTLNENADQYGFDFTTHLQQYRVKVLFLYSENNRAYGASWAENVSAPFPNVEVMMVENCGHEMLYFGWADLYPKALNYLSQLR
ncbi:MAG TPA: alpha/beta hydrolase [Cyclobacteriaceae bacterium]|nr:alpha/beta hydrolase [Cyclobacteriaceae bacterium]